MSLTTGNTADSAIGTGQKRKRTSEAAATTQTQFRDAEEEDEGDAAAVNVKLGPAALAAQHSGSKIAAALRTTSPDALKATLGTLRRCTALIAHDEAVGPSDARITLAQEFIGAKGVGIGGGAGFTNSEAALGVLDAWDLAERQTLPTLLPMPLFVLAQLLALLSAHQPTHSLGEQIMARLLPSLGASSLGSSNGSYWARLQGYLGSAEGRRGGGKGKEGASTSASSAASETLTLASIRLMLEMSSFAGGKYARQVFEGVGWSMKTLPRLLNLRRKAASKKGAKGAAKATTPVSLSRPDVRTLWILFLLSFLRGSSSLKLSLLNLGRDFLPAMLKGMVRDPPSIVLHILTVLHAGLLGATEGRVPRARVVGFFNEWTCREIVTLYERVNENVGVASEQGQALTVADVAHHFLLALCTHRGQGICFADNGWYGRLGSAADNQEGETLGTEAALSTEQSSSRIYNKILLGVLRALAPTRSLAQAELALGILSAAPELLGPFLDATSGAVAATSLEPRPSSSAWLGTAAFFGRALALPLPPLRITANEDSASVDAWPAEPPSLNTILSATLPAPISRGLLQRGATHTCRLTRHASLVLLCRVLERLARVRSTFMRAAADIGEGTEQDIATQDLMDGSEEDEQRQGGRWTARWKEVEKEARKKLPDLGAVVGAMHALSNAPATEEGAEDAQLSEPKDEMLLTEVCLRAVWLYHAVLPDATVSDAGPGRLDVGRLLTNDFMAPSSTRATADPEDADAESRKGLRSLCQLHTLRIVSVAVSSGAASGLSSGMAFDLFARASSSASSRSYFCLLLTVYISSTLPLIRGACDAIFTSALGASVMFEHDPTEWECWRAALPGADTAVDSRVKSATTELSEEQAAVLVFLDECVQRCCKTHYRYAESSRKLRATHASPEGTTWSALTNGADETDLTSSPLLSTFVEQLSIRLRKGLLDVLADDGAPRSMTERFALLAFFNRLLIALVGAGRPIAPLRVMAVEVQESLAGLEAGLVFLGETIISRLDAITSPPVVDASSRSNGEKKHAAFDDPTSPGELRIAVRSSSRPLTHAQVAAFLENAQRVQGAAQLLHELHPGLESISSVSEVTPLDVGSLHSISLPAALSATATVDAVEALTSATVAMARLRASPAQSLAMVQTILSRSCSHEIQVRVFSHPALLEHLALSDESFTTSTISLVTSSLDHGEARDRLLAQPLVERLLELLDSAPVSALVSQARELVPFFTAEALDRLSAILLRELTKPSQDRANAQACFGTLSEALASPRSGAARGTINAHLGTLLDGLATLTDAETAAEVVAIIYRALAASTMSGLDQSEHPVMQGTKGTGGKELVSSPVLLLDALIAVKHLPGADAALALALYRSRESIASFLAHLGALADDELTRALRALPHALHAALDVHSVMEGAGVVKPKLAASLPGHLGSLAFDTDPPTAVTSCASLKLLLGLVGDESVAQALQAATPEKPGLAFHAHVFALGEHILQNSVAALGKSSSMLTATLMDRGLLWLVRRFAEDTEDSPALLEGIQAFTRLVRVAATHGLLPKSHLAEPVIEAAIKTRLPEPLPMLLVAELSRVVPLKTAIRSQHVSSITSHALFRSSVTGEVAEKGGSRQAIIGTLHASIALDPARLCRPATMASLLRVYGATLSLTDRRIFEIFTLFEQQERASFASLASQWSPLSSLGSSPSNSAMDAVMAMDPALAFATCAAFPRSRAFGQQGSGLATDTDAEAGAMYDPLFVLSLVSTMLLQTGGLTGLQWLAMLRTNALGIVACSLSSRASSVRAFAASIMARTYTSVRNAQFQEREHLLLVLDALRDSLPRAAESENGAPPPPPLTITLFIAHVLRSLSAPSSFTYPIFARFLLQRAELDTGDVPLLYNLLLSFSDDQHRQERLWMLRFLRDCLRSGGRAEWRVFKRRHAWELLASLYAASSPGTGVPVDRLSRSVIEDIFLAAAALPNVAYELLQRRALAPWITQQIVLERSGSHAPRRVWMQLLDRALASVDLERLDRGTDATWAAAALDAVAAALELRQKNEALATLEEVASLRHAANVVGRTLSHLRLAQRTLLDVGVRRATAENVLYAVLKRVALLEEVDGLAPNTRLSSEQGAIEEQTEHTRRLAVARMDLREAVHQTYQATLALWHVASLHSSSEPHASVALFHAAVRTEVAWGGAEARSLSVRMAATTAT